MRHFSTYYTLDSELPPSIKKVHVTKKQEIKNEKVSVYASFTISNHIFLKRGLPN